MIGRLCGKVVQEEADGTVVVDVHGVGYDVMTPVGTLGRATTDADRTVTLHVHTHVREEAFDLFGFASELERRVFRLLLAVPNVGPKTALNALSALPIEQMAQAVRDGDVARLTRVPGIGKKTAERLVLELREKLPRLAASPASPEGPGGPPGDVAARLTSALCNMGYRSADAERAVKALRDRIDRGSVQDLLREALAWLAR